MASALAHCKLFGSSYDLVMQGWEPKENRDGVVYFVNSHRKITTWIHPYVSTVFEEIGEYNNVKYAAYRTALKLRFLQVKLGLNLISIKSIKDVFPHNAVVDDRSSSEDTMSCREIFSAVYKIMELSDSFRLHRDKLVQISEIILNLILEFFDPSRGGKVAKRSVRIALVVLSSAKLSDKYRLFFDEISDGRGQIQRENFLYLIYDLMQITELLKESTAFGTNVSAAVNSCLKNRGSNNDDSGNDTNDQSNQDDFYTWLLQEPICIVWLPTLHRVIATESVRHNVQCCVCNIQPMVGFRYRCMQCFRYDLCQLCFFQGLFSQGHRLKHPMQEYCFPTTKRDNTKALLKIVRNKMSKRHRRTKIKLLPVDDDSITGSVFQWQPRSLLPNPRGSFHSSTDSGLAVGSSDNDVEYQAPGTPTDQAYDGENLAMMKRWCKPVEVLGEPCNTSSPCVQENMSKKNMDNQQYDMAQTIQQLQEENRILRQKLSAARKREFEKDGSGQGESVKHIPVVVVHENIHGGDPLKEITTDEPISPINPLVQSDVPTTKTPGASFLTDREDNPREISVNVLELVGSYTPIQSTFCMEKDCNDDGIKRKRGSAVGSNEESGISEDDGGIDSLTDSGGRRSEKGSSISGDEVVMDQMRNRDGDLCQEQRIMGPLSQPPRNPIVSNVQMYATDTETESCTSNDLEYTYSDMSLKSEATSSRTSKSSKTHGEVTFDSLDHGDFENVDGFDCNGGNKMAKDFNADMDTTANDCGGNGNNQSSDLSPTNDTTGNGDHTSDFLSTNTTKNESSVELDAFKLCRMKFNTADDGHDKQSRNNLFDISNSQPRLIYSSKHVEQNRMEEEEEDQTCDFVCDSFRASRIMINASQEDKKQTPDWSQFHSSRNSFYPSFDLSVIPSQEPAGSFSFVPRSASSFPVRQSLDPAGDNRRKTMEPVYMSTPVADTVRHHGTSTKPVSRKKSTLAKRVLMRQQQEKENQSPLSSQGSGRSRSSNSISSTADLSTSRFHKREVSSFGATPKSSIPPSQRQRILLSMDRLEANRSYSCNDLTFDRDVGMTTLFDQAEHQRTVGAGGQSLPLEDKEELERLIEQVRIGESERSGVSPSMDVGDSSILKAVLGVGDAMADFVQATADVQMRKMESTHL